MHFHVNVTYEIFSLTYFFADCRQVLQLSSSSFGRFSRQSKRTSMQVHYKRNGVDANAN